MARKKKQSDLCDFAAGFLVMMSRDELNSLKAIVPEGITLAAWSRQVLLEKANPRSEKSDDVKDDSAA